MANIPISSFTAAANATGIGMSGFSLTGTNAQSMLDLAGTWNTTGTPTGIKLNVTDTTSNAASLLADLQVGGTSRFNVTKAGGGYFAGNVGIGTTNANARLVVSDSAAIATLRVDTSNAGVSPSNYSEIVLSDINSPRAWWRNVRDGSGQTGFGYNNHLAFFSAAGSTPVERVRFDSSGNVGIGTNSPGTPLDVIGTTRSGNFRVNAGGSVTGAGMWGIDTILAFNTGSTERMRIDSAGNLGVGTATPTLLFQVGSRGGMSSSGVFQWGSALTGNNRGILSWLTDIATMGAPQNLIFCTNSETTERMRISSAGNVGIGTNAPGYQLHLGGNTVGAITGSLALGDVSGTPSALIQGFRGGLGDFAGSLLFSTTTGPGVVTERMRITSTGLVGIGTTPSVSRLEVNGSISNTVGSGGTLILYETDAVRANQLVSAADASGSYLNATFVSGGSAVLRLQTAGNERMRIDSAGNVGIGTASPANRFVVSNGGANGFEFDAAAGIIQTYNRGTSAYTDTLHYGLVHRFFTGASPTEKMRIDASGNVLVGKTAAGVGTDGAQLIAAGFSGFSAPGTTALFLNRNTSDGTILEFGRNGVSAATMGLTSSALTVSTAGTERMRIESTGAVVLPKLTLSTDTPFVTGANINSGANSLAMGGSGTGVVSFFTNNTERMRVKANGQVRFIPLASAPAGPEAGDVYYDSTTNKLRCYNGTIWNDLF